MEGPELSILLPTWNRRDLLAEALRRIDVQETTANVELLVVDAGSTDDTVEMVEGFARTSRVPTRVLAHAENCSIATARNLGLAEVQAPAVLFLNDDGWVRPGLVEAHAAFHRERPDRRDALRGSVRESRELELTPFMLWVERTGLRFGTPERRERVEGTHFLTINVSAKTELIREVGGFDDRFWLGYEDNELGLRMEAAGMRLAYDEDAAIEHYHPIDLEDTLVKLRYYGTELAKLREIHPDAEMPRPPGARHRVKAAALNAAHVAGLRSTKLREETWRFLCHEAHREGVYEGPGSGYAPRIGASLARRAVQDEAARMPANTTRTQPAPV